MSDDGNKMDRKKTKPVGANHRSENPASLNNLRDPWPPGTSGNPAGRKAAGLSVREWMNTLATKTRAEVLEITKDSTAPVAKLMAARNWLDGTCEDRAKSGVPISASVSEMICDQTAGRPAQAIELSASIVGSGENALGFDFQTYATLFRERRAKMVSASLPQPPRRSNGEGGQGNGVATDTPAATPDLRLSPTFVEGMRDE
jgi:hypothetical protein